MVTLSQGWIHSKFTILTACPELEYGDRETTEQQVQLEQCFQSALKLAAEIDAFAVAFPAFDRYPTQEAIIIACNIVSNYLATSENIDSIQLIIFCVPTQYMSS